MAVVRSHNLSLGIVGLPNSGKSTIFNALTKSSVPAESYPFCTIDKNVGVVKIADERLDRLAKLYSPGEVIYSAMTFVDIAGLVEGASKGEGLGNQFLGHIREVDAIMYVLRAFKSESVTHVYDEINPVNDLRIVRSELVLRDIETIEQKISEVKLKSKAGIDADLQLAIDTLENVSKNLNNEIPAYYVDMTKEKREVLDDLWLLTNKPCMYVLNNKGGADEAELSKWKREIFEMVSKEEKRFVIAIDCKLECELDVIEDEEKSELTAMVDEYCGVEDIIEMAFVRLDLITFYTCNEKEAHAWTVRKGVNVKEAAGIIHTDFEENFAAAEVIPVDEEVSIGGWNNAKEKGLVQSVGQDYIVKNGDHINILAHDAKE